MKRLIRLSAPVMAAALLGVGGCGIIDSTETYEAGGLLYDLDEHAAAGEGTVKIAVDGKAVTGGAGGFEGFSDSFKRSIDLRKGQRITIEVISKDTRIEPDCSIQGPTMFGETTEDSSGSPRPAPEGGLVASCDWTRTD